MPHPAATQSHPPTHREPSANRFFFHQPRDDSDLRTHRRQTHTATNGSKHQTTHSERFTSTNDTHDPSVAALGLCVRAHVARTNAPASRLVPFCQTMARTGCQTATPVGSGNCPSNPCLRLTAQRCLPRRWVCRWWCRHQWPFMFVFHASLCGSGATNATKNSVAGVVVAVLI